MTPDTQSLFTASQNKKLKKYGIQIHNDEILVTLTGLQGLMSYVNEYRLPKTGNILDNDFFAAFLEAKFDHRELTVQYNELAGKYTYEDKGGPSAHSLMLYFSGQPPSLWFSAIQVGNFSFCPTPTAAFHTINDLLGGVFRLPDNKLQISIQITPEQNKKLTSWQAVRWIERIVVLEGTGKYKPCSVARNHQKRHTANE